MFPPGCQEINPETLVLLNIYIVGPFMGGPVPPVDFKKSQCHISLSPIFASSIVAFRIDEKGMSHVTTFF